MNDSIHLVTQKIRFCISANHVSTLFGQLTDKAETKHPFTNGYVNETFSISKRFIIKLQLLLIRPETLDNPLTAKFFIHEFYS